MKYLKKFEHLKVNENTENKIDYPTSKIEKLIDYYRSEYGDYMKKQGWDIFISNSPSLYDKYEPTGPIGGNKDYFFHVQVVDEPYDDGEVSNYSFYDEPGNALIGISTDEEAYELARKTGLMVDELGAVIGFQGQSLLD